jgi:hypothetical protein
VSDGSINDLFLFHCAVFITKHLQIKTYGNVFVGSDFWPGTWDADFPENRVKMTLWEKRKAGKAESGNGNSREEGKGFTRITRIDANFTADECLQVQALGEMRNGFVFRGMASMPFQESISPESLSLLAIRKYLSGCKPYSD